jgi:hypothetical protein
VAPEAPGVSKFETRAAGAEAAELTAPLLPGCACVRPAAAPPPVIAELRAGVAPVVAAPLRPAVDVPTAPARLLLAVDVGTAANAALVDALLAARCDPAPGCDDVATRRAPAA